MNMIPESSRNSLASEAKSALIKGIKGGSRMTVQRLCNGVTRRDFIHLGTPGAGFNPSLTPNNLRPCYGSVIARKLGPRRGVPAYVSLPKLHPSGGPAYLGSTAAGFVIDADPNAPNFTVPDIVPPPALATDRLEARRQLLAGVDRYRRAVEVRANRHAQAVSDFQREAFHLMTSPAARRAFDIHAEDGRL